MSFRELEVMQVAFELLSPLDPNAQQRVMSWLSAALADKDGVPRAGDEPAAPLQPVAEVPAQTAPRDSGTEIVAERATAVSQEPTAAPTAPVVEPVAAAEPEAAVEPAAETAPEPRPRPGRSAKATGRRAAKEARPAAAATPAQGVRRRQDDRPSGDQFRADLAAASSFKALAEKYGKSIGTIGNWANQLREQGFDIPVGRQKRA